jgi:hypothetical protein
MSAAVFTRQLKKFGYTAPNAYELRAFSVHR